MLTTAEATAIATPPAIISAPRYMWTRDPAVDDMITALDQPEIAGQWAKLTNAEINAITGEIERCRKDFTYAARNYFWIVNKQRQEQLFSLWEAQELILEQIMLLRAKGKSQRLLIVKARQLGCSTVVEALIAWRSCFFANTNSLVISYDPDHAAYLFQIMLQIYDHLPWWMQPMCSSRKFEQGLLLANPKTEERRTNPGLNSRVDVDSATAMSGVGMGKRLSAVHASEFANWAQDKARRIIEKDFIHALDEGPETLAVLESTGKGAGTFAHKLWNKSVDLGDRSKWTSLFFPSFFDKKHFEAPPMGWKPAEEERDMRDKVISHWLKCEYKPCGQYHMTHFGQRDRTGEKCPTCNIGILKPHELSDGFMHWMELQRLNAAGDSESLSTLKQEQAITAEDAFQLGGNPVFGDKAHAFAASTVRDPIAQCKIDGEGVLHGIRTEKLEKIQVIGAETANPVLRLVSTPSGQRPRCVVNGCEIDHSGEELPIRIFSWPVPGAEYTIGADPGEGTGQDNSAASVNKKSRGGVADEQVLTYLSNTVDTIQFARDLNYIGRLYNEALIAPEVNKFDTVTTYLAFTLGYPNMYRMRSMSSTGSQVLRIGWYTHVTSKPRLYLTMKSFLTDRLVFLRDRTCVEEAKTFVKDTLGGSVEAAKSFHDDLIMASMIGLYVAHEGDWDENLGMMKTSQRLTLDTAPWHMSCKGCAHIWPVANPATEYRCPACASMHVCASKNFNSASGVQQNPEADMMNLPPEESKEVLYDHL